MTKTKELNSNEKEFNDFCIDYERGIAIVIVGKKKLNGRNTVGMLRDDILDEFCKKHCPNSDEREFFEKYGRKCPNCYPESYHYWLIQRYGKTE